MSFCETDIILASSQESNSDWNGQESLLNSLDNHDAYQGSSAEINYLNNVGLRDNFEDITINLEYELPPLLLLDHKEETQPSQRELESTGLQTRTESSTQQEKKSKKSSTKPKEAKGNYEKNALKNIGQRLYQHISEHTELKKYFSGKSKFSKNKFQTRSGLYDIFEGISDCYDHDKEQLKMIFKKAVREFIFDHTVAYLTNSKIKGDLKYYIHIITKLMRATYRSEELRILKE